MTHLSPTMQINLGIKAQQILEGIKAQMNTNDYTSASVRYDKDPFDQVKGVVFRIELNIEDTGFFFEYKLDCWQAMQLIEKDYLLQHFIEYIPHRAAQCISDQIFFGKDYV